MVIDNYSIEGLKSLVQVNLRGEINPIKKEKYNKLIQAIDQGKIKTYNYGYKLFLSI